jgi:hypothetical protein
LSERYLDRVNEKRVKGRASTPVRPASGPIATVQDQSSPDPGEGLAVDEQQAAGDPVGAVLRLSFPPGPGAAWLPLVGMEEYREQAELLLPHLTRVRLGSVEQGPTGRPLLNCEVYG